jgi:hypothetical protein
MSAYAKQVLADYRPNCLAHAVEIFEAGWNMRRPDHQAHTSTEIQIGLPDKVEQGRAEPYQIAGGQD